jgi:O-palmitoleoyl-L-serine hydrolase
VSNTSNKDKTVSCISHSRDAQVLLVLDDDGLLAARCRVRNVELRMHTQACQNALILAEAIAPPTKTTRRRCTAQSHRIHRQARPGPPHIPAHPQQGMRSDMGARERGAAGPTGRQQAQAHLHGGGLPSPELNTEKSDAQSRGSQQLPFCSGLRRGSRVAMTSHICFIAAAAVLASAALGAAAPAADPNVATLQLLHGYGAARCLDGSAAGYYIRPSPSKSLQWVFSLQGGGECVDAPSCLARANSSLGSSTSWSSTTGLGQLQDPDPKRNPHFAAANHVFVMYCTGDLFAGQVTTPSPSTFGLFFSGHNIVDAVIRDCVRQWGLASAELVIFSGDSAGGIGVFINLDYVAGLLPSTVRVVGAPIGGFYFPANWPYTGPGNTPYLSFADAAWPGYVALWQAFVPTACAAALGPSESWRCMLGNTSIATLQSPAYIFESQTDPVTLNLHDGVPPTVPPFSAPLAAYVRSWSANMTHALRFWIPESKHAAFNAACWVHTSYNWNAPRINGTLPFDALAAWIANPPPHAGGAVPQLLMDDCGIVCNPSCPLSVQRDENAAGAV